MGFLYASEPRGFFPSKPVEASSQKTEASYLQAQATDTEKVYWHCRGATNHWRCRYGTQQGKDAHR